MCIICNAHDIDGVLKANVFLDEYSQAQSRMKKAAEAMLEMKKHVNSDDARRYDRIHKRMRKIMRDWNNIEHQREMNDGR